MITLTRRAILLDACGVGPLWVQRHTDIIEPITALESAELGAAGAATTVITSVMLSTEDNVIVGTESMQAPSTNILSTNIPTSPASLPGTTEPPAFGEVDVLMSAWEEASLHSFIAPTTKASPIIPLLLNTVTDSDTMLADIANMDGRQLQAAVNECTRCRLCHGREHAVFGMGDERASWLFIGEGPGQAEDDVGDPFVGPPGKLLDNMLAAIGVQRGQNAYITNIVKCRPVDVDGENRHDRSPLADEVAACLPYLQRQIALIQPTVLVALGKTAALSLLALDPSTLVASLRGKVHQYAGLPLVVTYHPAYLLRKPADKAKVWSDLCLAMTCHDPILQ